MKNKLTLIAASVYASLCMLSAPASTTLVTPGLTGKWYVVQRNNHPIPDNSFTEDNCGQYYFTKKGMLFNSAKEAISHVHHPNIPQCLHWSDMHLVGLSKKIPQHFPGNQQVWDYFQKHQVALPHLYDQACYTVSKAIDFKFDVNPVYACRTGSAYDSNNHTCTTTPTSSCKADVVGRDLNIPGLGWAGHVGMTDTNKRVIEVLDDAVVVHPSNSLSSFVHASSFWGQKYAPNARLLKMSAANSITGIAKAQSQYNVSYTVLASWRAASPTVSGVFRCDTFVDYAFKYGAGIDLLAGSSFGALPKETYAAFKGNRHIGPTTINQHKREFNMIATPPPSLEAVYAAKELNGVQANKVMNNFVFTSTGSRSFKENTLWSLTQRYSSDPVKFEYLVDSLIWLNPTDLMGQFIAFYKQSDSETIKLKLIKLLTLSYRSGYNVRYNPKAWPSRVRFIPTNPTASEKIQQAQLLIFFKEQIQNGKSKQLKSIVERSYKFLVDPPKTQPAIKPVVSGPDHELPTLAEIKHVSDSSSPHFFSEK